MVDHDEARPTSPSARRDHWESVYERTPSDTVSWFQPEPTVSLALIEALGVPTTAAVVDVGGGASFLVDRLLERGFSDVTVLDIAEHAVQIGQDRIGEDARVTWIVEDLLAWSPTRSFDLWHDRAVLHFLAHEEVDAYRARLVGAIEPGGWAILAAFAPDGPERCSGLPVTRYDAAGLARVCGPDFEVVEARREVHTTPAGGAQAFSWLAARRSMG